MKAWLAMLKHKPRQDAIRNTDRSWKELTKTHFGLMVDLVKLAEPIVIILSDTYY